MSFSRALVTILLLVSLVSGAAGQSVASAPDAEALATSLLAAARGTARDEAVGAAAARLTPAVVKAVLEEGVRRLRRGDREGALDAFSFARDLGERIGDRPGVASALLNVGNYHRLGGDYDAAGRLYEESLAVAEAANDRRGVALVTGNIGLVHNYRGEYDAALASFRESAALAEELGERLALANALLNIARIYSEEGDPVTAADYLRRSLAVREAIGDDSAVSVALTNLGSLEQSRANYGAALAYYLRALDLARKSGDRWREALALQAIGAAYASRSNDDLALDFYAKALDVNRALGNKAGIASILASVADLRARAGAYDVALASYREALGLLEASGHEPGVAAARFAVGRIREAAGDAAGALDEFAKAAALYEKVGFKSGLGDALAAEASALVATDKSADALPLADRAAALGREIDAPETLARARLAGGRALRALGRLDEARAAFDDAVSATERAVASAGGDERDQAGFFETRTDPYLEQVSLLAGRGDAAGALGYAERAKARVLLDVLGHGRVRVTKTMSPEEDAEERRLSAEVASLDARISAGGAGATDLADRLREARLALDAFRSRLYASHPELRTKRGDVAPVRPEDVRALIPGARGAALEYVSADDDTFLVVATPGDGGVDLKVYALGVGAKALAERVGRFRAMIASRDLGFAGPARELYDTLLGPARAQLAGRDALLVVPDGPLWGLPFQALRTPANRYVIEDAAVSYAPSLSVLREMRRARTAPRPPAESLLAVADPVSAGATPTTGPTRMGAGFAPLPEARRQVGAIAPLYGRAASRVYVGAEATEARVKADAARCDVLHLATHGVLDDASPLYSYVLLAPSGADDGRLEAREILDLDVRADLVVLSACETARGSVAPGEGVIGLSWAFFVAGCPTAVVSQWEIDSASTTELMVGFHRALRGAGQRRSPAEALRAAELALLRGPYRHPFYWAAFSVVGDGT